MQPNSIISKINIFLVLCLCGLFAIAEPGGENTSLNLNGIVENQRGVAIKGATISLERNGQTIETHTSDVNGVFSITIEKFYPSISDTYMYVRMNGYKTERLKVFKECCNTPFKVHLQPKPKEPQIHHPLTQSTFFTI